jgi:hypothetical protein
MSEIALPALNRTLRLCRPTSENDPSRLHCSKYRNGGWVEYQQIGSDVIERASGLADVFPNRRPDEFLEAAA